MENENKKLRELLSRALECLDKPKQPFKDGDVVENPHNECTIKIVSIKENIAYGLNYEGVWKTGNFWDFKNNIPHLQLSTPEKWLEVCKNEAVKRGIGFDKKINCSSLHKFKVNDYTLNFGEFKYIENSLVWQEYNKESYFPIMRNGIWAEVIKDKTLEDLTNEWLSSYLEIHDFIKTNPEAYVKAINNLQNQK